MPLHFNLRINIERETYTTDVYGSAVSTGTTVIFDEPARIDFTIPRQRHDAPQGMETDRTYSLFLHYNQQHNIDVREGDLVKIVFPPHHPEFGERFRIRAMSREATHPSDARGIIECTMISIRRSRGINF
jgi:hypothetical protein